MPRFARRVALVVAALLIPAQVSLAASKPRAVRGLEVSERNGKTMLDVRLHQPFRYMAHSPTLQGTFLRIRLRPVGSQRVELQKKQVLQWWQRDVVPLMAVEYDEEAKDGPVLILRFEKRLVFQVSQGADLKRIRVTLLPESARRRAARPASNSVVRPQKQAKTPRRTKRTIMTAKRGDKLVPERRARSARVDESYARRGFYFGAAGVRSLEGFQDEIEELVPGIDVDVDDSWGLNGRIGYRLHSRLALEVLGEYYDEYNIDLLGVEAAEFQGWSVVGLGKVYLLTGRFQPYALAGWGYLDIELSDKLGLGLSENSSGSVLRWGGGMDLYATRGIVLNLEASYALPLGGLKDLDYWTMGAGFEYRF